MEQGTAVWTEERPQVKLPEMACPRCGEICTPHVGPGSGQHVGQAVCPQGHHIRWLKRSELYPEQAKAVGDMNQVWQSGRVTRAPATRFEQDSQVTTFTVTVAKVSRDGRAYPLFVPCVSWGRVAQTCALLNENDAVALTGELAWTKRTGKCKQEHSVLVVNVKEITVLAPAASVPGPRT